MTEEDVEELKLPRGTARELREFIASLRDAAGGSELLAVARKAASRQLEASRLHGRRVGPSGMARWPARSARAPRVGCGCADVCLLLFMVYRRVFPC